MQKGLLLGPNTAKLYNTIVAERTPNGPRIKHGGWVTMSTAKAINTALANWGEQGRVFRKQGKMYFESSCGTYVEQVTA